MFKLFKRFHKKEDDHWLILTMVLFICLAVVSLALAQIVSQSQSLNKVTKVTAAEAGKKLTDFINQIYGQQVGTITVKQVSEESGLYKVLIALTKDDKTNEDAVYISQDGKLFIPGPQNINQMLAQIKKQNSDSPASSQNIPKQEMVKVEMFTMSYCPYGNQAEAGIIPVARLLGKKATIEPHYVIYNNYQGGGPDYCLAGGKYCSMHGIAELNQDVRELCLYKYQPTKFWDYLERVNKNCNVQNIETCWETEAKALNINASQIKNCLDKEGETLLAKEVQLNKKYDVSGSPAVFVNGSEYQGGRAPEDYKTAFCGGFKTPPTECSQKLGETSSTTSGGCGG